jgi:DDE superfamily endonuclease/Helix-turn-helix of DDE superfamily endonuclease
MKLCELQHASASRVRALFGLTPVALGELLAAVLPVLVERRRQSQQARPRQRAPGGGRKRTLAPYQELLLTLLYLRHNTSHAVVGELFGVSADTSENTVYEVLPVLREVCPAERTAAQKRWQRHAPTWKPDTKDRLLIDSFETPVPRPSEPAAQKRRYSGKKKRHTLKTQVVTDACGEVLALDAGHPGPRADQRIYEQSGVAERFPEANKQADLAYLGVDGVVVPQRKPRGKPLTDEQRRANRELARTRVYVEHGIRRIKGWRIVRGEYRLPTGLFPLVASVVVGLVQVNRLGG